jgi:hypothetical protein
MSVFFSTASVKIEFTADNFFFLPVRQMSMESDPFTGRIYFIHKNRIVAVATRRD